MAVNSTQAGYLTGSTGPVYDSPLDRVMHDVIAGVTGLPGALIRPRWQPEPPATPDIAVNWIAFGNMGEKRDTFAHVSEINQGDMGQDVTRTEEIKFLVSVYGPRCNEYAAILADGFMIGQNRDGLIDLNASIVYCTDAITAPALINGKWVKRADMEVMVRRRTVRRYNVAAIESAHLSLDTEVSQTAINIER